MGISGYNTNLHFQRFEMLYSTNCELNQLLLEKLPFEPESYCGNFPSWNESCPCESIQMTLIISAYQYSASFTLSYAITNHRIITLHADIGKIDQAVKPQLYWSFAHILTVPQTLSIHVFANNRTKLVRLDKGDHTRLGKSQMGILVKYK